MAVAVPARSFPEHRALGVGLIRRHGSGEPTVVATLVRLLTTTLGATGADPARWRAIEDQVELVITAAEKRIAEPADLAMVHAEHCSSQ